MKHALVFVHGMGSPTRQWADDAIGVLRNAWSSYRILNQSSFDLEIEPVVVVYNDEFERYRQDWMRNPSEYLATLTQGLSKSLGKTVARYAETLLTAGQAGERDNFFWTHAADVLMYRFDRQVRSRVNVLVANQILEKVVRAGYVDWSIVAHSLGTAVIHNTLHALYNTPLDGETLPLQPGELRPVVLAMVANVSRVLQLPNAKVYETIVRPAFGATGGVCSFYLNMRNKFDPFVIPKPFDPEAWPDPETATKGRYRDISVGHITRLNVHDIAHYLENPRCHIPLFRGLFGRTSIRDNEMNDAIVEFDSRWPGETADKLRSELERRQPSTASDWRKILDLLRKYNDLM